MPAESAAELAQKATSQSTRGRFAAIVVPDFALQAVLRHEPELHTRAVALVEDDKAAAAARAPQEGYFAQFTGARNYDGEDARRTAKAHLLQLTSAAKNAGVVAGMTTSQAQARCPDLLVRFRSAEAERIAQSALLEAAFSLSSFVEDTRPGVCVVELISSASAAQNSASAEALLAHLNSLHLHARIGLAPNADLAQLTAGSAAQIREISRAAELHDLPLTHLQPPPHLHDLLRRWGIQTIGAYVALGREALVARLGAEVLPLHDRAAGKIERPLRCLQPPEIFEESAEFEHEIETLEPLLFLLRRFLEQLSLRLEAAYRVAADLTLRLGLSNGEEVERIFKVPSPTANVETLFRMLQTHLESFTSEHPIVRLQLSVVPARPVRQQFGLFESALRDPNQFAETLARLVALLGDERVGTPVLEPTHRPDAFQLRPADFTSNVRCASPAALPLGLALRRFRPPQPARVKLTDRPVFLEAAALRGTVTAAYGPMLLSGDWWAPQSWSRAEWDVQISDGTLCRIFEQAGEWFLEGIYD